jgi:hypothetical protein
VTRRRAWLLLACVALLVAGCDETVRPIRVNDEAFFSLYGYLDLNADTQWVRVMPVRQSLFLSADPIDAVVTLEHVGSGAVVTLRDSAFSYRDQRLDRVAYAHNFWTAERLDPGASYRLTATRSDGRSTTTLVVMPDDSELIFRTDAPFRGNVHARTGRLLNAEVLYLMRDVCSGTDVLHPLRQTPRLNSGGFPVRVDSVVLACHTDYRRHELRTAIVRPDWAYAADLSDIEIAVPGRVPSGPENGVGFVGGVASWTIPFHTCTVLAPRPDRAACELVYNARSASISGRVVRQPCGAPHALRPIRLVEEFTGGGAIVRTWSTGVNGEYRFPGIEPGTRLVVELEPGVPVLRPPQLRAGERHVAEDIAVHTGC